MVIGVVIGVVVGVVVGVDVTVVVMVLVMLVVWVVESQRRTSVGQRSVPAMKTVQCPVSDWQWPPLVPRQLSQS